MNYSFTFNKKEKIFIAFCLVSNCVLSTILYFNITATTQTSGTDIIGKTTYARNDVQRKFIGRVSWKGLTGESEIFNKDSIITGLNSEVTMNLKDGTIIELGEGSLVVMELSAKKIKMNVEKGYINVKRDKVDDSQSSFTIVSDKKEINLKDGELKLTREENTAPKVFIKEGEVDVTVSGKKTTLLRGETASLREFDIKVSKQKIKLLEPEDSKFFIFENKAGTIKLRWEVVQSESPEKINEFIVEVSKNLSFTNIISKKTINKSTYSIQPGAGTFYWRVQYKDGKSGQWEKSETRKFVVLFDKPFALMSPAHQSTIEYAISLPHINFAWQEHPIASSYILEISSSKNFKSVLKTMELTVTRFSFQWEWEMEKGRLNKYYWRVKVNSSVPNWKGRVSKVSELNIKKLDDLKKPVLVSPVNHTSISNLKGKKFTILFNWESSERDMKSIMQISRDRNFKKIIKKYITENSNITIDESFNGGKFFWRVQQFDNQRKTKYSDTWDFTLNDIQAIALISPSGNIEYDTFDIANGIDFAWKIDIQGTYLVEIAKDKKFVNLVYSSSSNSSPMKVKQLGVGTYYWRISLMENNEKRLTSGSRKIIITETLLPPVPIYPRNGTKIEMSKKDYLELHWEKARNIAAYRVEIFQIVKKKKKRKNKLIVSRIVKVNKLILPGMNKLDIASFYWSIESVKIDKEGKVINSSKKLKQYFSITIEEFSSGPPDVQVISPGVQVVPDDKKN